MMSLNYPILMVHGMGYRDGKCIGYWGRIPKALENEGCRVFFGNQDSNGTIESNGAFLADRIREILRQSDAEKLNVIAHSKGGLDMRYAISSLGMDKYIASLSTISTPHNGSYTMDKIMKLPRFAVRFIAACSNLNLRIFGDKHPDAYRVFESFTTGHAERFNQQNPDSPDVYYQSYAFTFSTPFSDMIEWFPHFVVKCIEGENDGLLTPRAVAWGNFRGVYTGATHRGISHVDEIDLRRRALTKKRGDGISDIVDFYLELVRELQEKGF
ncbi:MAG: hypothetical protein IJH07_03235 [Ruminococcus sp.]|nr:hypothetical protein [Ruminococcus sp.]